MSDNNRKVYGGFEQGPIRPPSEANSLLIRVTRNCPWNRCTFCSVYKNERFSRRPVEHVIRDIDQVHSAVALVLDAAGKDGVLMADQVNSLALRFAGESRQVFFTAVNWLYRGEGSVFLQDANSLIIKPEKLEQILNHLNARFPWITRITSYARSHTINRISDEDMLGLADAGLNRIHIGMESGSDKVLEKTLKGVTKAGHISAGRRIKSAGMELSEYVMPGLGGKELSREHALETADALNQINPDFIRLRTLCVAPGTPLQEECQAGAFRANTDLEIVNEIRLLISSLDGIDATVRSDHVYNLLQNVDGKLPEAKERILAAIDEFLALGEEEQQQYRSDRSLAFI